MAGRFNRIHLLMGAGALALAIPVLAQSGPESLLPPGFGDQPAQRPTPAPTPAQQAPQAPALPVVAPSGSISEADPDELPSDNASAPGKPGTEEEDLAAKYDLPAGARRSLDRIGPLKVSQGGLGDQAFGHVYGAPMARIMRETRAPLVSRWGSILLRRALLSESDTPQGIDGADWVAERAWLLLRMGEADNARLLIQGVDNDQFTRRLYAISMQTSLASADPAGFCPLLPRARSFSAEPSWFMAQAICASFQADQNTATALLDQARRRGIARGIDYRLAEKVVGAGPNSRRQVKIEWEGTPRLTTWRFGLATATNVEIPADLYGTVGRQVRAWEARAPALPLPRRMPGTMAATRLGVFSGSAALGFFDQLAEQPDADATAQDIRETLRSAYAGATMTDRVVAMRQFWGRAPVDGGALGPEGVDYAALPVLARAAARLRPDASIGADTPWLIAAMLSSGYDSQAARWGRVAEGLEGPAGQRAWALLATGAPQPAVTLTANRIGAFVSADESEGGRLGKALVASLAGLGRLPADAQADLLQAAGVSAAPNSRWSRALMAAAGRGERGTVALLVGVGMQTADWRRMPATHLYFITAALRQVGLDPYARMIAAEAMARS